MLIIYLFWSPKNNKRDFSKKCKSELLILFVYTPIVLEKPTSLATSVLKNIFLTCSE